MPSKNAYVAYLRVSTDRQGRSGLGLEAQTAAIQRFADASGAQIVATYTDIESGTNDARPQLAAAIEHTKRLGGTLVVATLDRLSRDVAFLATLMKSGLDFRCADMPTASTFELHIRAAISEEERRKIGERTRAALAAAKSRGVKLGGYRGYSFGAEARSKSAATRSSQAREHAIRARAALDGLNLRAMSLRAVAAVLMERGVRTPRGKLDWTATGVRNLLRHAS